MAGATGHLVDERYRLIKPVGQGGMGRVWRGHDELLDREVAIKEVLLPNSLAADQCEELIARAMREARAAARLHHPGIVAVHDAVIESGAPWIVMEFLSGPSVGQVLNREGRLGWERVAALGADVADALAHAHATGVVHRDVKPDNVLLAGRRTVLTDFGIARVVDATMRLTKSGMLVGTPNYVPPEQLQGRPMEAPGDLWALGATLFAAVEGRPPFDGLSLAAVWTAILTQPLPPPRYAGPLAPVLDVLLSKDPRQRPDALETAQRLNALQHPSVPSVRTAPTAPLASPDSKPARTPTTPVQHAPPTPPDPGIFSGELRKPHSTDTAPEKPHHLTPNEGEVRWKTRTGNWGHWSPAVSDGMVYVGGGRHVYALDAATGEVRWKTRTGSKGDSSPAVSDGIVYIGSRDKHVYALDAATGDVRWKTRTGSKGDSSPAVSDGIVYIGSRDKHVY
ncbi:PQQ-binding-like beta-propeller repeat protein, partial [Streptomyces canus]|uniref:serine/threonine-protein kinase n=1 Tax=Streptomyces canus TaxID=58343 RepID=UPI0033C8A6A9